VWYAKIEHERKHGFDSPEVKAGLTEANGLKAGDQRHIHIIVSRCAARENGHVLQEGQLLTNADRTMSLSPMTNQRGESAGAVKSGFDREQFYRANERSFDEQFAYGRGVGERYEYCNALKNGHQADYDQSLTIHNGARTVRGRNPAKRKPSEPARQWAFKLTQSTLINRLSWDSNEGTKPQNGTRAYWALYLNTS